MDQVPCPTRLARLRDVFEKQKAFLHRIPDPNTRERAEDHLFMLGEMIQREVSCLDHREAA